MTGHVNCVLHRRSAKSLRIQVSVKYLKYLYDSFSGHVTDKVCLTHSSFQARALSTVNVDDLQIRSVLASFEHERVEEDKKIPLSHVTLINFMSCC